jgi:hypothetical protein
MSVPNPTQHTLKPFPIFEVRQTWQGLQPVSFFKGQFHERLSESLQFTDMENVPTKFEMKITLTKYKIIFQLL